MIGLNSVYKGLVGVNVPKAREGAKKPRVLRLHFWIFSMRMSEEERSVRDRV